MSVFKKQPGRWMRVLTFSVTALVIVSFAARWVGGIATGEYPALPWGLAAIWAGLCMSSDFGKWFMEDRAAYYRAELFKARERNRPNHIIITAPADSTNEGSKQWRTTPSSRSSAT